jgi:hypothetical protein
VCYAITEGDALTLDASGSSSPNGKIVNYLWDLNGDGVFGDAVGVKPTVSWSALEALGIDDGKSSAAASTYQVRVKLVDAKGYTAISAPTNLVLQDRAPVGAFPSVAVREGGAGKVAVVGATDPSRADTRAGFTYSFDFGNTGTFQVVDSRSPSLPIPAAVLSNGPGKITVRARVKDKDGGYTDYLTTLTVLNVALTPIIVGASTSNAVGAPINLTASATDPSPADVQAGFKYAWVVAYGGAVIARSTTANFSFTPRSSGTYVVVLQVTDKDGDTASTTLNINVGTATGLPDHHRSPGRIA